MVVFQWNVTQNVWTLGSKVMRFLRFQPKLGHAVNHCQCSRICPKMKLWNTTKNWDFSVSPKKNCTCRGGTRVCFYHSNFQSKKFSYAIFILKKQPLYVNFSISPCGKWFFSQCSTPLVGMRFWEHVPNSLRNKNMERHIPYLLKKMVFLAFKTLLSP
jgi:hypothetical protein